ncbi:MULTISPECIES: tyrosine-type recombinase/integrase [Mycolicibacterium]|uniref:Putative prophage phiRv2 integrase n=1 Tax=Mycolicibacterium chlorophenolicum TaxID=37916 RepID=A0A0J6Z5J0_9MYCO|nr:site-specific integrase [Mycolicibacterium chlorophenolicum]KMO79881.1 putative prophage phiRv2 integrase [Mycolicibacterium chlorophenolicum]
MKRNRRAGVEDRWNKTAHDEQGNSCTVPSANHGKGSRWRARYVDDYGKEHAKAFTRKAQAQAWLNKQVSDQITGAWTDPSLSAVTFGTVAERWISTKANRLAKTVAGYRSLLDTIVLPRWEEVPLREVRYDDLQVWIAGLTVDGSVRFEGKGLSASRVRQTHQLVGAVLNFAVRAKHLPANPADGIDLPRLPETEQRYLTHDQLHRVAVASGNLRTLVLVLCYCGLRFGEAAALRVEDVDVKSRRIRVRRSVTYVRKTGLVEGPTKNHTSRTVPVPKFLSRLLATEIEGRAPTALMFPSARGGGYLTLGQARYSFQKACGVVAGCDGVRLHDLRHSCASMAISAGANVKVVQQLLGHITDAGRGAWCDGIGRHSACGTTSISAEPDSRPPLPHCGDGRGPARTTPGRRADACAIDMPLTRGATRTAAAATPTSRRADRVVAGSQPHVDTLQTKEVAPLVVRLGQSS